MSIPGCIYRAFLDGVLRLRKHSRFNFAHLINLLRSSLVHGGGLVCNFFCVLVVIILSLSCIIPLQMACSILLIFLEGSVLSLCLDESDRIHNSSVYSLHLELIPMLLVEVVLLSIIWACILVILLPVLIIHVHISNA